MGQLFFPWEGLTLLKKMTVVVWGLSLPRDPCSHSFTSLPNASHSIFTSVHTALFYQNPRWVAVNEKPVHCPPPGNIYLYIVALSPRGSISPQQVETPWPLTAGCYMDSSSELWCSVLGSPVWDPGFTSLREKLPQPCCSITCEREASPFSVPILLTSLEVVSVSPWLKVSSQVVFGWLFWVVPLFNFITSLVLGGGTRKVLLFYCHFGPPYLPHLSIF